MIPLGRTTIRNPVIVWQNKAHPDEMPHLDPPGVPFTVTRSEVVIRPGGTAVYIWYSPPGPAEPAGRHSLRPGGRP